jgi:parvulin-like peptidyl-prolyl isomerase
MKTSASRFHAAAAAFVSWLLLAQGARGEIVNGIAAKVGSTVVTINEFNKAYSIARKQALLAETEAPSKKTVMEALVDDILVQAEGERRGIVVTDEEVNDIINDIKRQNKFDDAALSEQLAREGLTIGELKGRYAKELMRARLANSMEGDQNLEVTEEDVRSFYDDPANRERLSLPGTASVKLSRLLLAVPADASYREAIGAKDAAQSVYQRAAAGEDFPSLVLEFSSAPENSVMGTFTQEQLLALFPAAVANAIAALAEGGVLPPLRVKEGYVILRVDGKNPETMIPYEEAKENIRGFLYKLRGDEKFNAWLKEKRRVTRIEFLISME